MGGAKSKIVAEKSVKAVVNHSNDLVKPVTQTKTQPQTSTQLDPAILKEISKWSTVKVFDSLYNLLLVLLSNKSLKFNIFYLYIDFS